MTAALDGHACYRLSLRRSDLFCRHATCRCSPGLGSLRRRDRGDAERAQAAPGIWRQSSRRLQTAQTTRAILLATATAALLWT